MSLRPASSSANWLPTPRWTKCNPSPSPSSCFRQAARDPCRHESQKNKTPAPEHAARQRRNEAMVRHARQRTNYMAESYHAPHVRLARLLPRQENLRRLAGDARNQESQFAHLPDQAHAARFIGARQERATNRHRERSPQRKMVHLRAPLRSRLPRRAVVDKPGLRTCQMRRDSSTAFRLCSYDWVVRQELSARTEDSFW